jgi:hypothetical protein
MPKTRRVVLTDADRQWLLEFIGRGERLLERRPERAFC